jgi:hypothetical protein
MQDTSREYDEHDWLVQRMSGDVLIGGLGIGMIHIPLLASSDVTSVTIVEKEQDVIDLVWAELTVRRTTDSPWFTMTYTHGHRQKVVLGTLVGSIHGSPVTMTVMGTSLAVLTTRQ